jgi:hypothetical protein
MLLLMSRCTHLYCVQHPQKSLFVVCLATLHACVTRAGGIGTGRVTFEQWLRLIMAAGLYTKMELLRCMPAASLLALRTAFGSSVSLLCFSQAYSICTTSIKAVAWYVFLTQLIAAVCCAPPARV